MITIFNIVNVQWPYVLSFYIRWWHYWLDMLINPKILVYKIKKQYKNHFICRSYFLTNTNTNQYFTFVDGIVLFEHSKLCTCMGKAQTVQYDIAPSGHIISFLFVIYYLFLCLSCSFFIYLLYLHSQSVCKTTFCLRIQL